MCSPFVVGIVAGGAQMAGGIMQAQAKHRAAKAAAKRRNQINELNYRHNLNIAARKDKIKGQAYARELTAQAAATEALHAQQALNQQEKTRASIAAQQQLNETSTELSFKSQENLAASIQAQGTVLASGQQAGQSLLLTMMDAERALGFEEAAVQQSLFDANKAYNIQEYGFALDKYSADARAANRLPGAPAGPWAEFGPTAKPIDPGPSGLGLMGGIISAVGGGISTGLGAAANAKKFE